jgi:hypothetical protein
MSNNNEVFALHYITLHYIVGISVQLNMVSLSCLMFTPTIAQRVYFHTIPSNSHIPIGSLLRHSYT